MKRHPFYLVLLILLILLAAAVACRRERADVEVQDATPLVLATPAATLTFTFTPRASETRIHSPEPALYATSTQTPTIPSETSEGPSCAPPPGWVPYTVQSGENLLRIGERCGMSAQALQYANCLPSPDRIQAGQIIYIPFSIPSPTPLPPAPPAPLAPAAPAPTAVPTERIPVGLKEEIFFDPGGEPGVCDEFDSGGDPRQIVLARVHDGYKMCVYGFPEGEQITIRLFAPAPDGDIYVSKPMTSTVEVLGTPTIVKINLWMPVGLPKGTWLAVAQSTSDQVQKSFVHSYAEPAISVISEGELNPFETHTCSQVKPDGNVIIRGTKYEPNKDLSIGIYLLTSERNAGRFVLQLVDGRIVRTDDQGDFSKSIPIDTFDSGAYRVILITDLGADEYSGVDANNDCYIVP